MESKCPEVPLHGSHTEVRVEDRQRAPVLPKPRRHQVKEGGNVIIRRQTRLTVFIFVCLEGMVDIQSRCRCYGTHVLKCPCHICEVLRVEIA